MGQAKGTTPITSGTEWTDGFSVQTTINDSLQHAFYVPNTFTTQAQIQLTLLTPEQKSPILST